MYYIFNKGGNLLSTCDFEPDIDDLQTRGEYFTKSNQDLVFNRVVGGKYGGVYEAVETPEEVVLKETKKVIQQRNNLLNSTDWITTRHFEEKMSGKETTLSNAQIEEFLVYRQELRDLSQVEGFPFVTLPQQPEFLE